LRREGAHSGENAGGAAGTKVDDEAGFQMWAGTKGIEERAGRKPRISGCPPLPSTEFGDLGGR
jgi:hypothetical protein